MAYLPFRGLSAWFSCSVDLKFVQQWEEHGGLFADHMSADFLFSESQQAHDTVKAYSEEVDVVVFKPSWIETVLQEHHQIHDVPLGQYILHPHFMNTLETPPQPLPFQQQAKHSVKATQNKKEDHYAQLFVSVGTVDTHEMWAELERQAKSSRMSEAVYIGRVDTEKSMYRFDCSKPQFIIKRID